MPLSLADHVINTIPDTIALIGIIFGYGLKKLVAPYGKEVNKPFGTKYNNEYKKEPVKDRAASPLSQYLAGNFNKGNNYKCPQNRAPEGTDSADNSDHPDLYRKIKTSGAEGRNICQKGTVKSAGNRHHHGAYLKSTELNLKRFNTQRLSGILIAFYTRKIITGFGFGKPV
jgi:hypothetical protein